MESHYICCVGGCGSTSVTHRLFSFPKNDSLRNLWMSFLVPTNSLLIGLTKEQLLKKRVCEKHFDRDQFDDEGRRLRYSYPCLLTSKEVTHGVPLNVAEWDVKLEHNYVKEQNEEDLTEVSEGTIGTTLSWDHNYSKDCSVINVGKSLLGDDMRDTITLVEPSCSSIGSNVVAMQTIKKTRIHVQKGASSQKLVSKKRKFFKHVTKLAIDSVDDTVPQRLIQAQTVTKNEELLGNFNLLNKQSRTFLLMQLKQVQKSKMARRFTLEEKLMALLLMKQSPKGYKLLEKMFALPNKRTLMRLSEKVSIEPGLNPKIFDHIAQTCKNWDMKQKLCTVIFDKVSLTPHLTFNEKKEIIYGFVDVAGVRKIKYCDHALVFMLRGICSPWKQSIAYYFCEGTTSSADLQNILKQIIPQVALTGLQPLGLVCDQGSTFRTAMKTMRQDTVQMRKSQNVYDDGSINIGGYNISLFYDPPHLLKGVRNNFLNKDVIWNGKRASWKDIEFIFDIDSKLGHTRALPKLTAYHIDAKKIKKMKVSVAAQVLSARTAAMLKFTAAINNLHKKSDNTMATTAEVVEFFDRLFDSVNGYPGGAIRGKLRQAVKKNSSHHLFWSESIKKIKNINFLDSNSRLAIQSGKSRLVKVPSLQGWITTLESFIRVSKLLFEEYNVEYYYPRHINQDSLENFFGRIRAINCRNINPDANTFIYAFKSLMFTNILSPHSKLYNCEDDNSDTLLNVSLILETDDQKENVVELHLPSFAQQMPESFTVHQAVMEKVKVQCSAYTAGYICRKISKSIHCKSCVNTFTTNNRENIHSYIEYREYKSLKNHNLMYPSEKFLILYRKIAQLVHDFLLVNCAKIGIKSILRRYIFNTMRFSWLGCSNHNTIVRNLFVNILIRLQVHNWCNIINKILKGGIDAKYVEKMGVPQKLAFSKYKSFRLRKKSLGK